MTFLTFLAACLPAAAIALHAVPFGEPLGPVLRLLWAGAATLLSLAWVIDTERAATPPLNTLNRRRQGWALFIALGMIVFGNRVYWPTRPHQEQSSELYRVTPRGPGGGLCGSYTATADELARESERKKANIGLVFLLFGSLIFSKALRDALGPQRKTLHPRGADSNGGTQHQP